MLKKLAQEKYINYSPYHGSTLTDKGTREAKKITRKHRLLETFLSDVLHIGKDKVHSQACELEHALSDEAEESLCRLLKHQTLAQTMANPSLHATYPSQAAKNASTYTKKA
jgi:DtxR family Mn-dependent transcriptional regulator